MSKDTKPRAVDEHIKANLREPEHFVFTGTYDIGHTPLADESDDEASPLFNMNEAALEGRHTFYERESIFARTHNERQEAKAEMARTAREIARRKIVKRNEANKTFAGRAATELEAEAAEDFRVAA